MNETMELLAPAGGEEALRAAVCAGADAVYLGYARFGARASAANFDAETLEKAVAYAHLYHVRVHVTVNTLVKPDEMEAVLEALSVINACRADAVIVQDLGVARLAREHFPGLTLHTSTQMGIHTAEGAKFARAHGFRRVVLARECSLSTIAEVAQTGVETEVFVHGALCASVSGQCLLSSMAGGRSGNRGRCAQPCRQALTLGDYHGNYLSMRDLCLRDHLPELASAGVRSLKIEGRLKRPEYVAVVTGQYRKALDALARGEFAPATGVEMTELKQIYHRGGFTVGHAMGAEDAALCDPLRSGHGGVPVGSVLAVKNGLAVISLQAALHDGDSLRVESAEDVELRYSGPEEQTQAVLRLRPGVRVKAGDAVTRLADARQLQRAQNLSEPPIPVSIRARIIAGEPLSLHVDDGENDATATGETAQTPRTRALTREEIARALTKFGDTPFTLNGDPVIETDAAFAPVSSLNALRRDALAALADKRRKAFESGRIATEPLPAEPALRKGETVIVSPTLNAAETLAVSFAEASLGQDFQAAGANLLLYAPTDCTVLASELPKLPRGAWLCLPPQMSAAAFWQILPVIADNVERLAGIVLGSVGQLGFPGPLPLALGDGVPVTNREAARELLSGNITFFTLWPELNAGELEALLPDTQGVPALLTVYGRERVMLLNHCPERVARGLRTGRKNCGLCGPRDRACATPDAALTDRRGYRFPLRRIHMPEGCVIEMLNALPTDLSGQAKRVHALGVGMRLCFTVEPPEAQIAITRRFAGLMAGDKAEANDEPSTCGHFLRGVE
ncbi:MAG: U32 family peptidase [Eubacteriales bacterium]|nr:U32 family peptidase [Eubacteriales bacterium]